MFEKKEHSESLKKRKQGTRSQSEINLRSLILVVCSFRPQCCVPGSAHGSVVFGAPRRNIYHGILNQRHEKSHLFLPHFRGKRERNGQIFGWNLFFLSIKQFFLDLMIPLADFYQKPKGKLRARVGCQALVPALLLSGLSLHRSRQFIVD